MLLCLLFSIDDRSKKQLDYITIEMDQAQQNSVFYLFVKLFIILL